MVVSVRYRMVMALSRADWVEGGLAALGDGGLSAVAVEPVAKKLGTTKGSFYWHFSDRNELLSAVLDLWEERETTQVIAALEELPDPRTRLVVLGRGAYARASRGGAHAALLAAAEDPRIAPVIERVTRARLAVLERMYLELGFGDTARRYARLAYSVYLGAAALHRADPNEVLDDEEIEQRIQLFVESVVPSQGTPQ